MRVLFDLYQVQYSTFCGVYKYATRILDGWYKDGITNVTILTNDFYEEECHNHWPLYSTIAVKTPCSGYLRKGLLGGLNRKKAIDKSGCDIVFVPMFEPLFIARPKLPVVMTVHDLQAFKIFKGKLWLYNAVCFPIHILFSKAIISITKYTETQLKQLWYYNEKKGKVIHNPVTYNNSQYSSILDYPYILCVNTIVEYKNQLTLINAFASIQNCINHKLVLVGNAEYKYWSKIRQTIEEKNLKNRIVHLSNIREDELISLYQHASLFVTSSTMEGFGQTPIEAAIYKCPVISSMEAALPESTLRMLNYYEPVYSAENLAKKILEVLSNPSSEEARTAISDKFKLEYDIQSQSVKVWNVLASCFNK